MYSQTSVTVRPSAMPHAAFSGAPARIIWSAASKSMQEAERREADADQREDDGHRATAAQAEALAATDAEHRRARG